MTGPDEQPFFLWTLFQQLRRRGFALGPAEYQALRLALRMGFGWSSRYELLEICSALWATSREEQAVVAALFNQHMTADWELDAPTAEGEPGRATAERTVSEPDCTQLAAPVDEPEALPATAPMGGLPPLQLGELPVPPSGHVFLPQYPVSYRTVAQAWRRLRWPVGEGPATELDVDATVQRRSSLGVVSPPVLRPRRRNRAKLLLLVDRQGSMAPFHAYVDEVCQAICQAGQLREVAVFYFHDTPLEGADPSSAGSAQGPAVPQLGPGPRRHTSANRRNADERPGTHVARPRPRCHRRAWTRGSRGDPQRRGSRPPPLRPAAPA